MKIEKGDGSRWSGREGCGHKRDGGGGDEADDGEAKDLENDVEGRIGLVGEEPTANDEDEGHGEDENGKGGDEGTSDGYGRGVALGDDGGVACIGGGVNAYGTGGDLADGQDVGELLRGEPAVLFDNGTLDEGYHRIAAAEGEEADDEEGVE